VLLDAFFDLVTALSWHAFALMLFFFESYSLIKVKQIMEVKHKRVAFLLSLDIIVIVVADACYRYCLKCKTKQKIKNLFKKNDSRGFRISNKSMQRAT
jgi:hypothetical protein